MLYIKQGSRYREAPDHMVLDRAQDLAVSKLERMTDGMKTPIEMAEYLQFIIGHLEAEKFVAVWLDTRHRVIKFDILFTGTIDGSSVYPREVVKAALACNASAVVFAHNHPSGVPEPSSADIRLTKRLKAALELIDVRVLDHIIVGGKSHVSLAVRGLI